MPMTSAELLIDAFGRVKGNVHAAVRGLSADQLAYRVTPAANSIGWLIWHLTRVQDDHFADAAGTEQRWTADGWADRFDLPFDTAATGYGQRCADVAAVRVASPDLLTGYYDAVHAQTVRWIGGLTDDDLSVVIDEAWDPPVTLGVRLVSVVDDDIQHAGQAMFIRGLLG